MRASALYRALLYCYPAAFRDEYGQQMLLIFSEQLGEARRTGRWLQEAALWANAACDALIVAPKEHCHVMFQDVRYAVRAMAAQPGFTAVAILSLALGIGANTAIFSLWNGVLRAPLRGVREPQQLIMLTNPDEAGMWHGNSQGERDWLTYSEFEQLRDHARSFSSIMASESSLNRWQIRFERGDWEEARGRLVSGGYFDCLGVRPALGRLFTTAEDHGSSPYAVISYEYWLRRFGGSAGVLGATFTLRNAVFTIIGVAGPGFGGETVAQKPDFWLPIDMQPLVIPGEDWLHETPPQKVTWLHVFGRLKPGVTPARAEAEANAIFKAGLQSFYGSVASPERRREFVNQWLKVHPGAGGASTTRGEFGTSLTALFAAVAVLLLIACANLANLLLARCAARKSEMAMRISLGASRGRLIRQLLTESIVLAVLGALCGLAAAWFVFEALVRAIVQSERDFQMAFSLDPVALAFTAAVTLTAAVLFGLLPAWHATRGDATDSLKAQRRSTETRGGRRWGRALVALQLALSLPLLVAAGLLSRTFYNLQHVPLGSAPERLLMVGINSRVAGYNSVRSGALFRELLSRIESVPGVEAATFSHNGILTGSNSGDPVEVEGYVRKGRDDEGASWDMVGPKYFATIGIPLLLGRDILESDNASAPKVCVVNEAFAEKFFARRNPLGMRVTLVDEGPGRDRRVAYRVIGVARNARTSDLRGRVEPRLYMPMAQPHGDNVKRANYLIRTAPQAASVFRDVRQAIQRVDAALPIDYARSLQEQIESYTAVERVTAQIAVVFGCVALALAAIGLYGVLSYGIARRQSEIAIRMALGAQPARVIAMILEETSVLVFAGLTLGAALTYLGLRFITSQLYGVAPQDPATLAAAAAVLVVVAFSAVYMPALRASRLDPIAALRE